MLALITAVTLATVGQLDATVDNAKKITDWLQVAGGWGVAVIFLFLFIIVLRDRLRLEAKHDVQLKEVNDAMYTLMKDQIRVLESRPPTHQ